MYKQVNNYDSFLSFYKLVMYSKWKDDESRNLYQTTHLTYPLRWLEVTEEDDDVVDAVR